MFDALWVSTTAVALAEMGDKTQLLALMLAARWRKPWPIVAGIAAATVVNHALAGALGAWLTQWLGQDALRWIVGGSFLAVAAWMLIPDKLDDGEIKLPPGGVFIATVVAFFVAEMGDKTQVATVVLAARFDALWQVVVGTTAGMLLANAPVVFMGDKLTRKLPLVWINRGAAVLFAVLGVVTLLW
ncbi:MAG: TMEM165/GDT1 family protein [Aquabacterium sp.]|jgi:Ca2+/H+ antiporter, TMEM165/GDT1 family|uniref:TMEM165/GDT1 family protein n=1 Tax=Aquabacterium sp. TaxID=1872578 RepID=UPI003BB1FAE0